MKQSQQIMDLIKDINQLLEKGLKNFYTQNELTVPQLTVVTLLSQQEHLKITDISKEMKISAAAVSGIIDRLENHGIVERKRSTTDKRIVYVSLNDSFKNSHQHLEQNISGYLHLLLRDEPVEKVNTIVDSLTGLKVLLAEGENKLTHHIHSHTNLTP